MSAYLDSVKILVVDERDFIRSLVRQVLFVLGCKRIDEARNGDEAWMRAVSIRPDVVITCWEMSPTNGLDLTRRLRNDPDSPNPFMPIIMMTSYAELGRVIEARDAGISEYVIKPLSAKSLYSRIHSVIEHPRQYVRTGTYFGPDRRRKAAKVAIDRRKSATKRDQSAQEEAANKQAAAS